MPVPFTFEPVPVKSITVGTDPLVQGDYYAANSRPVPLVKIYKANALDDGSIVLFDEEDDVQVDVADGTVLYPLRLSDDLATASAIPLI
ncbi:MAG: hypothetical protein AAFV53_02985 [Myxococcota bacterium]